MTIQKINSMVKWAHDVISFLYKRSEQLKNKREEDWVGFEPAEFLKYWKQTLLKRKMPEHAGEKVLPQKWWTRGAGICVFNYKPFIYFYVRCILREISRFCYKICCEPKPRNMSVLPRLAEEHGHFFLTAISRIGLVSTSELGDKRGYFLLARSMSITFLTQVSSSLSLEKAKFQLNANPRVKV